MADKGPKYSFIVEYYDPYATDIRKYILVYYHGIKSVEMHDERLHRMFLKPTKIDDLKLSDLYLGASITILSRTLKIVEFADQFTRKSMCRDSERCVAFVRPGALCNTGRVLTLLESNGFRLVNLKLISPTSDDITGLFEQNVNNMELSKMLTELSGNSFLAVEMMRNDACRCLVELTNNGPAEPGASYLANADLLVFARSPEVAACQAERIFENYAGPHFRGSPRLNGTTLAIIKPHAVTEAMTGHILAAIQNRGFCITAARLFRLTKLDAAEFLEVYKGVVHEYPEMLEQLASGPCVALEIAGPDPATSAHQSFREFVGPADPEIARFLRPDTLRAKFGIDKVKNALHCTDLPDDAELEVNFFFRILDK